MHDAQFEYARSRHRVHRPADPHSVKTISAMIVILRSVRDRGGDVRLVAPSLDAGRMLGVTGLDKLFRVFESVDSAQAIV